MAREGMKWFADGDILQNNDVRSYAIRPTIVSAFQLLMLTATIHCIDLL